MADIPQAVSMSTGVSSGDAEDEADCPILTAAKSKLAGAYALEALPQTRDDPLWQDIKQEYGLQLQELGALKNYAFPVVAQLSECSKSNVFRYRPGEFLAIITLTALAPFIIQKLWSSSIRKLVSTPSDTQPSPRGILRRIENATLYRISDQRIRARFIISNTLSVHQYSFSADLLVDPGANTELKLPARKVMQLGLRPVGVPVRARGSTNNTTYIMKFSPVLVTATFNRDGTEENIEAYLDVKCDKNEYDHLVRTQQNQMTGTGGQVLMTPTQPVNSHATAGSFSNNEGVTVIQLSPIHHRPQNAPLQQAVIGIDGLRKLKLHLNCDHLQLEIEEDEWVEEECQEDILSQDP